MTRASLTIFVDCIFLFIAVLLLLPTNPSEADSYEQVPPGSVVVQAEWTPGVDVDVDLWTQAPGDVPVGYSNKGGAFFNLLRDDLGNVSDVTPLNMEYSFTRGRPAGEYVVNLHYFSSHGKGIDAIPVHVEIRVMLPNKKYALLFSRDVILEHPGQEITVQRFTLDEQGNVVSQSLIPKPLRSPRR